MDKKILFIGAGNMATAIASGLVKSDAEGLEKISAFDPSCAALESFTKFSGIKNVSSSSVESLVANAEVVILAVKPQYLASALNFAKDGSLKDKLIISIVAGVKIEKLRSLTGAEKIVRVMPNTPALIGEGVCGYTVENLTDEEEAFAKGVLESFGQACKVDERLLSAVTGLSGCGPAYVYEFIMALADGGVLEGLPRKVALELAVQTVIGSAKMVQQSDRHPAQLRDDVISPGGATARGVAALDRTGFKHGVICAVTESAQRAEELGK